MRRENNFVEAYKNLKENRNLRAENREKLINEAVEKRQKFINDYHSIRESREMKQRRHGQLVESCRDNALGTAIKAIYITALEAGTLTDNGIILAENMVDAWIKENGGASKILNECKNKTYLLSRIAQIVEEAAIIEAEEIENIENDKIDFDDSKTEDVIDDESSEEESEINLALKVVEKNLDSEDEEVKKAIETIRSKASKEESEEEQPKEDESKDEEEESEAEKSEEEQPKEDESKDEEKTDPLNDTFDDVYDEEEKDVEVPDDATTDEDDNESDVAEDIVDDLEEVPEEDITVDGDTENNGKVFDELEKEEDVKKAIELIRQRVADAEETFIKRNAEDKKAIDELIGRISDNVKTVEDISDENDPKSKIAEESARIHNQKIKEITEHKSLTVLEKMTRNLHSSIVKDQVVREQYLTEDGNMDTALIVESAKVMYAFLETLNTLQLEKVDAKYIEKILNEM